MHTMTSSSPTLDRGSLVIGTVAGGVLVAIGLTTAYLAIGTPIIAALTRAGGDPSPGIALAMWACTLVAGGAFVVAGTDRLAIILVRIRRPPRATPVLRNRSPLSTEVVVLSGVTPTDGRPIPELVVGPFGVAVVHELPPASRLRRVGDAWESRTPDGWRPAEDPRDRLTRDAERVRRWLAHGELEFVVRVYAALVAPDLTLTRTPTSAVITEDQVAAWLAALPLQRSLNAGRRARIVSLGRATGATSVATGGRSR